MKCQGLRRFEIMCIVAFVCFLQIGCQEQTAPVPSEREELLEAPVVEVLAPQIQFEDVVCDLGEIGPGTKNVCNFKFTSVGDGLLKIKNISKTCGCTPFTLKKREYAPGESGTLKVSYNASSRAGPITKHLRVYSNDKANPEIKLTVKGRITEVVSYEPKKLNLVLNKENAVCPEITIRSLDAQPFSIKGFKTTGRFKSTENSITADYNPSVKATEFVIQPKVDVGKLKRGTSGRLSITLACPQKHVISIPFKVLPKFKVDPRSISIFNAEAGKSVTREVWIVNNYGEDFEIESTSSQKGSIKVLSQEKEDKHCKFELEITPPTAKGKKKVFTDVLFVNMKDGEELKINCRGYYTREASSSSD
ncbi:MAG: DUF1573 domain-containing protein [Planctomycetota bacterium]|nr:MAG: DUF1573 domain-containing protein [Planctomycetota bacterium]